MIAVNLNYCDQQQSSHVNRHAILGSEAQYMEMMGLEPTTSALQRRRSPN